jgi:pimeloyl-ACP methyl ester carboxylesterase
MKNARQVAIAGGIELAVEQFGRDADPAVLLVMGLGAQMVRWPVELCEALAAGGFRVIRFDNRDCGASTHLHGMAVPDLAAAFRTGSIGALPYTLDDMASDCVGLLDAMAIGAAHIVGVSMGGAIAQIVAATFPGRTLSLTSMMASSGNPALPPPMPAAERALLAPLPRLRDRASIVEDGLARQAALASPGYPMDKAWLRALLELEYDRAFDPKGVARQLAAIIANGDRRRLLRSIEVPTLVLHGAADPLIPLAHGQDTASNIPGAVLQVIADMGHDLPPTLGGILAQAIIAAARRGRA